jgi:23S rRNA pseudouridine2605 synthase
MSSNSLKKTRISKFLSSYNIGSRREVEKMIVEGRIQLNGTKLTSPVHFVDEKDSIKVDGKLVLLKKNKQIYKFYKPQGYICSKQKQDDRGIVYEILPKKFKNFIFAGRLDINSEGLLIITNSGEIARNLELPKNEFIRKYKVRVYGILNENRLKNLSQGTTIDEINYKPFKYKIFNQDKKNFWLEIELKEGKNREIRELMRNINLRVNKLIRLEFGPFKLGTLKTGEIKIADNKEIKEYENYIRSI